VGRGGALIAFHSQTLQAYTVVTIVAVWAARAARSSWGRNPGGSVRIKCTFLSEQNSFGKPPELKASYWRRSMMTFAQICSPVIL